VKVWQKAFQIVLEAVKTSPDGAMSNYDLESSSPCNFLNELEDRREMEDHNSGIDSFSIIKNLFSACLVFSLILISTYYIKLSLIFEACIDLAAFVVFIFFIGLSLPILVGKREHISNIETYRRLFKYPAFLIFLDVLYFKAYFFIILLVINIMLLYSHNYSYKLFKASLLISVLLFTSIYLITLIKRYFYYFLTKNNKIKRLNNFYSKRRFPLIINNNEEYFISALKKKLKETPKPDPDFRLSMDKITDILWISKEMGTVNEKWAWISPLEVYFEQKMLDSVFKQEKQSQQV